jgi:acyl-CoA thioesterase-1
VNAGRSGDTSAGGLSRLDWALAERVDVMVVELGANDGLRGQPTAALADNLREVVDRTRAAWPEVRVLLVGMEAPTNLGAAYTERFRAVFSQVAEEKSIPLVPFLLDGVAGVPELNQSDRIHPTAEGHARVADTVWPYLEPLLRAAVGGET